MSNRLMVHLEDGEGNIIASQPYYDFQYGQRLSQIVVPLRGRRLIEILHDDLGNISYEDNRFILKKIILSNIDVQTQAMNLLGKIAEAVIVRRCQESSDLNRRLFQLARRKSARLTTSDRFYAIGTGLKPTEQRYPKRYNPSDPQRDIIWVDEDGQPALMAGSSSIAGVEAGLQVKVSLHGIRYMVNDLLQSRYEVPMIYFPINNDFDAVIDYLLRSGKAYMLDPETQEYRGIIPGKDIVDIRAYDYDSFEEVKDYFPIICDLLDEEIQIDDLVDIAFRNSSLENAVFSTALQDSNANSIIIR